MRRLLLAAAAIGGLMALTAFGATAAPVRWRRRPICRTRTAARGAGGLVVAPPPLASSALVPRRLALLVTLGTPPSPCARGLGTGSCKQGLRLYAPLPTPLPQREGDLLLSNFPQPSTTYRNVPRPAADCRRPSRPDARSRQPAITPGEGYRRLLRAPGQRTHAGWRPAAPARRSRSVAALSRLASRRPAASVSSRWCA